MTSSSYGFTHGGKVHPYQERGPSGSFHIRQISQTDNNGKKYSALFISIDMPGVPEGSIKINKHSDVNCVTFYGRAPVLWPNLECSDRVYAGFIAINTDPANINLQYSIVNGCFRIVIPNCDGTLHHVGHRQNVLRHPHHHPHHDPDKPVDKRGEICTMFIEHDPQEASGIKLKGAKHVDVNPFQISGMGGVYEDKLLKIGNELYLYVRVDIPTVHFDQCIIKEIENKSISFTADSVTQECKFDFGTRCFTGMLKSNCECCLYEVVLHDIRDGVLRLLARMTSYVAGSTIPSSNVHYCKPFSTSWKISIPNSIRGIKVRTDFA